MFKSNLCILSNINMTKNFLYKLSLIIVIINMIKLHMNETSDEIHDQVRLATIMVRCLNTFVRICFECLCSQ